MDTLSVAAMQNNDAFDVSFRLVASGGKTATYAGVIAVKLSATFLYERAALAELAAIHFLLHKKEIHGPGRLGNLLRVQVTQKEIKKALAKGSLKRTDNGQADNFDVARFAGFMATKYFEAVTEIQPFSKWKNMPINRELNETIEIDTAPIAPIDTVIGSVVVSRHAMNRFVERFSGAEEIARGIAFTALPEVRWRRAWKIIEGNMPQARPLEIPPHEAKRVEREYGQGVTILHHHDSQAVFVVKDERGGKVLVTVLRDNEYCSFTTLPTAVGQQIVYRRS